MEPITKFWMVWCQSRGGPIYKHGSKAAARAEAERLSRQNPGQAFIVLAAVDAVISPIKAARHGETDQAEKPGHRQGRGR